MPFAIIETSNAISLFQLAQKSTLIRSIYELLATGKSTDELHHNLKKNALIYDPEYAGADKTFRIQIESFNHKISANLKLQKINELKFLGWQGKVDLKEPDNSFHLIEFYGTKNGNPSLKPLRLYFGKWICDGNRKLIQQLSLSTRKFISNTSMDVSLSLIMSNLAKVMPNDLILDPFVGSGSLLVAAAKHGAYVMGCDIDYLLLHGRTKPTKKGSLCRDVDENIFSNLKQYNLENKYIDVMVADSSLPHWKSNCYFDAIITDPPYGIRESSIKIGSKCEPKKVPVEFVEAHYPSKVAYKINDIVEDLIEFADQHLKIKGRLVFWFPMSRIQYCESDLPEHCNFTLMYHAAQNISRNSIRVLICMEKHK